MTTIMRPIARMHTITVIAMIITDQAVTFMRPQRRGLIGRDWLRREPVVGLEKSVAAAAAATSSQDFC